LGAGIGIAPIRKKRCSELNISRLGSDKVLQIVKYFDGKRYITGCGARNYLDHERFEENGVDVQYMKYAPHP